MVKVVVKPESGRFTAIAVVNETKLEGSGRTVSSAIGEMIIKNQESFNIQLQIPFDSETIRKMCD